MFTEDGPYGVLESSEFEPRWTFKGTGNCVVEVSEEDIPPLPPNNRVVQARTVRKISHAIKRDPAYDEEVNEIDLEEDADHIARIENRLLIRPTISKLRERTKSDTPDPDNVVDVSEDDLDDTLDSIENISKSYRDALLKGSVSRIMAFDMASGQTEAIVRDCFDTEIEIDDEMTDYIQTVSTLDLLAATLKSCANISEDVWKPALREYLTASLSELRIERKQQVKAEQRLQNIRRFKSEYENMVTLYQQI